MPEQTGMEQSPHSPVLQVFWELLRFGRRFGPAKLQAVLVASPGDDGLPPEIHTVRQPC